MIYLNFAKHKLFEPKTYHRRYENDLMVETVSDSTADLAKRAALTALPFLALYRPVGLVLSVGMGGCRVFSHLGAALEKQRKGEWIAVGGQMFLCAMAVAALASSLFHFGLGLAATTCMDTAQGAWHVLEFGLSGEWERALEELLQVGASGTYLAFMATGALELILLSTLIQGLVVLYQAREEIERGHYIEAGGKVLLAGVRGWQGLQYKRMIERRNRLFSLRKYQDLVRRAIRGREVRHLIHSELNDRGVIEEKQVHFSSQDQDYDFGSHFHGYGKGMVKGANLTFRTVTEQGKTWTEVEFKVNHVFRDKLEKTLQGLSGMKEKEMQEILSLTGSHATGVSLEKEGSLFGFLWGQDKAPQWTAKVGGLGTISVGKAEASCWWGEGKLPNLYDRVVVKMEEGNLYKFHELMAFVDLDEALCVSAPEDLERLKLGHLFRIFFPKEAYSLERSESFFTASLSELRADMESRAPGMREVYNTYFHRMKPVEILPGRVRFAVEGLSDEVRKYGMSFLTAAVTGPQNDDTIVDRVCSMLSMGMMSIETRDEGKLGADGLSKGLDYLEGGADSVYVQMEPDEFESGKRSLGELSHYRSRVRLLIDLKALENGSYQYEGDVCGTRRGELYKQRESVLEFAASLRRQLDEGNWDRLRGHELMLKERVAPQYIRGMYVEDAGTKSVLLSGLRARGFVHVGEVGEETIMGIPVDQFIRVRSAWEVA